MLLEDIDTINKNAENGIIIAKHRFHREMSHGGIVISRNKVKGNSINT